MSKQLALAAAASTFALAALALLGPGSAHGPWPSSQTGATMSVAAPVSVPGGALPLFAELLPALK